MAREIVRGDEGVEHVLGHAIVQALTHPPRHGANVQGWFRSTMVNASIDWLRRSQNRSAAALKDEPIDVRDQPFDAAAVVDELDRAELREIIELLRTELGRLEARERRVVEMIYYDGLTTSEAANRLELSTSTVERSKRLALEAMRRQVGEKPSRYGRAVLALAGAPARLWSKEVATGVAASGSPPVAFLSVALLALVSITTFTVLSLIGEVPERNDVHERSKQPTPAEIDRRGAIDLGDDPARGDAGEQPAALERPPAREAIESTRPGPAASAPTAPESLESAEPRQVLEVRITENGEPLGGLRPMAWLVGPDGLPQIVSRDEATLEEGEPGLYRFDLPVAQRPWNLSLTDPGRGLSVWLERQLGEGESREEFDLPLGGRSYAIPFGQGENYGHPSESPWGRIKGIASLGTASWLFCTPRPHGGIHDGTAFERPFDGFLHFDAARDHGFTLSYWEPDVDPLAFEPVEGVREVPFVPPTPK